MKKLQYTLPPWEIEHEHWESLSSCAGKVQYSVCISSHDWGAHTTCVVPEDDYPDDSEARANAEFIVKCVNERERV